jgi:hypothetical protein
MQQEDCPRCGQKVKCQEDYIKADRRVGTAVLHWTCFIALMEGQGMTTSNDVSETENSMVRDR